MVETQALDLPDHSLKGIPSLRALFESPASLSAERLTRLIGPYHLHRSALALGIEGTSTRNWQRSYDALYMFFRETGENPMVCDCTPDVLPTGLRWQQADNREPVTVFVHDSINAEQRTDLVVAMAELQAQVENLKFELVETDDQPVDIYIDKGAIDGSGRTLGVARFTDVGDDLNNRFAVNLYIRFDEAERWDVTGLFLAVAIHELGHGVGIGHFDDELDNMNSSLRRIIVTVMPWFKSQLVERYLERSTALS